MAKKRKTLPSNFYELVRNGDESAIWQALEACEIGAYDSKFSLRTALHYGLPNELVRRLIQRGEDINARDYYGRTPLHALACSHAYDIAFLIELGAQVNMRDNYGNTPLHFARFNAKNIQILLDHGADLHARNDDGQTALEKMLAECQNIDIAPCFETAKILLAAGESVNERMKASVKRIGEEFEFARENFARDYLAVTDAALSGLYALFSVPSVPRRQMHDGISPIALKGKTWQSKFDEIWQAFVPAKGVAKCVQGEIVRVTGRLEHEILDNGGINWDEDFRAMSGALAQYFAQGEFAPSLREEAINLARKISRNSDEELLYRVAELAVAWVEANPLPVALKKPSYKR